MCTVTFSPRKHGYALAMNRDEQLTRAAGLPSTESVINGRRVLAPSEPSGGTWISVNDSGVTFALINWYSINARIDENPVSRGKVVRALSPCNTAALASQSLELLPLKKMNPFRLIGVFPNDANILEWRWDLSKLIHQKKTWQIQQWVSSGFDEPEAQRMRGITFQEALRQKSVGSLDWLRRLHRSHLPTTGPFSTCMHRSDAATVSYTEITVFWKKSVMRYFDAAPCKCTRGQFQKCCLKRL